MLKPKRKVKEKQNKTIEQSLRKKAQKNKGLKKAVAQPPFQFLTYFTIDPKSDRPNPKMEAGLYIKSRLKITQNTLKFVN